MIFYRSATSVALLAILFGCGPDGFNGTGGGGNGFRGQGSSTADRYESIFLSQGQADSFTDNFVQGVSDEENTEAFIQGEKFGALDLMLVVDNSGSMGEEQANLSTKLQPLLSRISNADWNIGITNTDVSDGCDYLITKDNVQPNTAFRNAVNSMGTSGSGDEAGLYKAVQGLSNTCGGQQWVREDSTVAILIISDEDNCSFADDPNSSACPNTGSGDASYLTDYLATIRTPGQDARVYGIISQPANPCADALYPGVVYNDVIQSTGG